MESVKRYQLGDMRVLAKSVVDLLKPYCERIEIAGSVRRECATVKDIEIVCIPSQLDMFEYIQTAENMIGRPVKGTALGKYMQVLIADKISLDLFMTDSDRWGMIYAIRTGSAGFVQHNLARAWSEQGYKSEGGILKHEIYGTTFQFHEEEDLFEFLGVKWVDPKDRL